MVSQDYFWAFEHLTPGLQLNENRNENTDKIEEFTLGTMICVRNYRLLALTSLLFLFI
jgi:hypothetical protein